MRACGSRLRDFLRAGCGRRRRVRAREQLPARRLRRRPAELGAIQDSIGRMYFGNRDGMLSFDGTRWHMWYIPYGTAVRSMMFDAPEDRIYVGGSQEFGYFKPHAQTGSCATLPCCPISPLPRRNFRKYGISSSLKTRYGFRPTSISSAIPKGRARYIRPRAAYRNQPWWEGA